MKSILSKIVLSFMLIHVSVACAQKVTIKDVDYKLSDRQGVYEAYVLSFPKKAKEITLVGKIEYNGKVYDVKGAYSGTYGIMNNWKESTFRPSERPLLETVILDEQFTSVPNQMFERASQIKKVILPNTIISIGHGAFSECLSLQSINLPASLKTIGNWAFEKCVSLSDITGIRPDISIQSTSFSGSAFDFDEYKSSFYYFSYNYIIKNIETWQKKGEFETQSQYESRVTKENQDIKAKELLNEAISEYTKKHKYYPRLNNYDADNQLYLLNSSYGDKYVRVPIEDAPSFKENFRYARFNPTFVLSNNELAISDLTIKINGKEYKAESSVVENTSVDNKINLPDIELPIMSSESKSIALSNPNIIDNTIDQNIPLSNATNSNTFAFVIGNEKYQRVMPVPFANNDAHIFAEYCKKALGLPEKNVRLYENASYGSMIGVVTDMQKIAKAFKGNINIIFYYAGHGIPDEATGDSYLLPIDADGINMRVCYPLNQLYKELGDLNVKNTVCFMDCCFSGAERGDGMVVAARGVAIKAKSGKPTGNTIVFTAATDKQTAFPYKEKGHGMFTYYLLKKLHDTKGDCTLGDLGNYVCDEVAKQAVVTNGKEQTPVVLTSANIADKWRNIKLK